MKILTRKQYYEKMGDKKIYGKEDCPFCFFNEKLIWEGNFWKIIHNFAPYTGDKRHLMVVPKRHIKFFTDLKQEEILELRNIHKFAKNFFLGQDYFSFTRESIGNRSVEHLHIHFLAGRLQGKFLRKMLELQGFPIKEDLKI